MIDLAGQTLRKRYQVEGLIGHGSIADVYKAYDNHRGYHVAIKVLCEDLSEDKDFVKQFRKDARLLVQLQHANIVRFYSFERVAHHAFIVMDLIEGQTLLSYLHGFSKYPPPECTQNILNQIGRALHYAHSEKIVHGDVKPGNVLLTQGFHALLSDFGTAKLIQSAISTTSLQGTPAYMSPEQCSDQPLIPQSDIYSLGIVAFEMYTGQKPFKGDLEIPGNNNPRVALMKEHLELPPPVPSDINPNLGLEIDDALLTALEKSPSSRYQTILEFLQDLGIEAGSNTLPVFIPMPAGQASDAAIAVVGSQEIPMDAESPVDQSANEIPPISYKRRIIGGIFTIIALMLLLLLTYRGIKEGDNLNQTLTSALSVLNDSEGQVLGTITPTETEHFQGISASATQEYWLFLQQTETAKANIDPSPTTLDRTATPTRDLTPTSAPTHTASVTPTLTQTITPPGSSPTFTPTKTRRAPTKTYTPKPTSTNTPRPIPTNTPKPTPTKTKDPCKQGGYPPPPACTPGYP